ncbi:hypothetical protein [Arcobacter vandammei]|uniref:hypothetical protein n=1 Tax=Arcobacter vandammei TaxID=2782243 RepID=UPI0018DF9B6D|nr:hypothetical protein [Arcobacter vandammei]
MKNILKIVFLGVVAFSFLVYLTIPKDKSENIKNIEQKVENIPKNFEIIGKNIKKDNFFTKDNYIVLLNHDSLVVFKDLYKKTNKNIVLVANISNTPWLIKNIAVEGELEKMYKDSEIALISDSNGDFRRFFGKNEDSMNSYIVYKVLENNQIKEIYKGNVKKGALQEGILAEDIDKSLEEFLTNLR